MNIFSAFIKSFLPKTFSNISSQDFIAVVVLAKIFFLSSVSSQGSISNISFDIFHLDQVIFQLSSLNCAIISTSFVQGINVQALFLIAFGISTHVFISYIIHSCDLSLVLPRSFISVSYLFIRTTFQVDLYLSFCKIQLVNIFSWSIISLVKGFNSI